MSAFQLNDVQHSQLLIIDQQDRLIGAMPEQPMQDALGNTFRLIKAANLLDVPVILSEQYPKGLGDTHGKISEALEQHDAFEKTCFSCCGAANYADKVAANQRKQLIITGIEAHVCVLQTAFEFQQLAYQVYVVEDATCSRDEQHKQNALDRMRQAGIQVTNHESVVFEWLRDAKHPQFKSISSLLK